MALKDFYAKPLASLDTLGGQLAFHLGVLLGSRQELEALEDLTGGVVERLDLSAYANPAALWEFLHERRELGCRGARLPDHGDVDQREERASNEDADRRHREREALAQRGSRRIAR